MSERNGIEIDFCPQCRGVWLDRGELDKIIEKSSATMSTPDHQAGHHQSQQHNMPNPFGKQNDYYKYKRKKSFLEEIFD